MKSLLKLKVLYFSLVWVNLFNIYGLDSDYDGFIDRIEEELGYNAYDDNSHPLLGARWYNGEIILYWYPFSINGDEYFGSKLDGIFKGKACVVEEGLFLDGKGSYLVINDKRIFNCVTRFSVGVWVKVNKWNDYRLFGKSDGLENRAYICGIVNNRVYFQITGENGERYSVLGRSKLESGMWIHLCVVVDLLNEEKVKVYIDGNKEDLAILENGDVKVIKTVDVPFILGAYDVKIAGKKEIVKNSFNGYMKSLVFCIGILKEGEIKELTFLASNGNLGSWLMMDSDEDGMVDVYERKYFGNVKRSGDEDNDGDGLCNLEESRYGTNPCRWDSDGDCLDDGWEVVNGLDAMDGEGDNGGDGDPDGDGLVNLIEYKRGMNPMKGYEIDCNGRVGLIVYSVLNLKN